MVDIENSRTVYRSSLSHYGTKFPNQKCYLSVDVHWHQTGEVEEGGQESREIDQRLWSNQTEKGEGYDYRENLGQRNA